MKKTLIVGALVILLLTFVVSAGVQLVGTTRSGTPYYSYDIEYPKGWQLIPSDLSNYFKFVGAYGDEPVNDAETTDWHNNALRYSYFPAENKYVGVNPKTGKFYGVSGSAEYALLMKKVEGENVLAADWYYFDKTRKVTWLIPKDEKAKESKLKKGWNLIVAPKDFKFGDCVLEKIYLWNLETGKWDSIMDPADLSDDDVIGLGFAVKAKESCTLGKIVLVATPELPSLPN